ILSISSSNADFAVGVAAVVVIGIVFMARPLLFASVDEAVAAARGVHVRAGGRDLRDLVGATVARGTTAVCSLLQAGLLDAPAGQALGLEGGPYRVLGLSAALGVGAMWIGLGISRAAPRVPPSFAIVSVASAFYALSFLALPRRRGSSASM